MELVQSVHASRTNSEIVVETAKLVPLIARLALEVRSLAQAASRDGSLEARFAFLYLNKLINAHKVTSSMRPVSNATSIVQKVVKLALDPISAPHASMGIIYYLIAQLERQSASKDSVLRVTILEILTEHALLALLGVLIVLPKILVGLARKVGILAENNASRAALKDST